MSGAIDKLSPEEEAQLRQMQSDDAASEPARETPESAAEPSVSRETPDPTDPELRETAPLTPPMVDKRALDEERLRRQSLQRELSELRSVSAAERARVEERLRLLTEATQAKIDAEAAAAAPPAEPMPDFATDPAAAIQWGFKNQEKLVRELSQRLERVETGAQSLTQAQQQNQQTQELVQWGQGQEAEIMREVGAEEYNRAVAFLRQTRAEEFEVMGRPAAMIPQLVMQDVLNLARDSRENGQQFGRILYNLAVRRGYQKANGTVTPAATPAATTPAAQVVPSVPTPETATERLLRGQDMATTVGAAGGAPRGEPAAQHIAAMTDEEFGRYYAKVQKEGGQALRSLFGE